eukprot:6214407-Pleurochrysis_carterae.AAC.3
MGPNSFRDGHGTFEIAWRVLCAVTHHTFDGCMGSCAIFAWSLIGVQPVHSTIFGILWDWGHPRLPEHYRCDITSLTLKYFSRISTPT